MSLLSGSAVRVRTALIDCVRESTRTQRAAGREFFRARRKEAKADRRRSAGLATSTRVTSLISSIPEVTAYTTVAGYSGKVPNREPIRR